jgi:pimeloyl-ACP methyl ester carboxylesterase
MFCPDEPTTTGQGVRLITIDRPGYGGSHPVADPSLTGFAMDLERLADHLWLGQFPVVGWSGSAPYAAACAAWLGERVSALGLVAAPAPGVSPAAADLRRLAGDDPQQALAAVLASTAPLAAEPGRAGAGWASPSDAAARRRPGVERALQGMWDEGLRAGPRGLAADLVAGLRPWEFDTSDVRTPASLFYGDDDPVAGLPDARWWEEALPDAHVRVLHGGHLLPVMAWPDILSAIQR